MRRHLLLIITFAILLPALAVLLVSGFGLMQHEWAMESKKPAGDRRNEAEILRDAYMAVDARIGSSRVEAGTCAVQFYLIGSRFLAANVGDSRVIIGTSGGVITLTEDHKPGLDTERSRIESLGGRVIQLGVPRVEGVLAISRALGDYCLKPSVIAEPRISEGALGRENDYALLACDGVWDVLTAEETMAAVRREEDVQKAAEAVTRLALDRGSSDNITVIVLELRPMTATCENMKMTITGIYDFGGGIASKGDTATWKTR